MKNWFIVMAFIVSAAACKRVSVEHRDTRVYAKDLSAHKQALAKEPSVAFLRNRLWHFFETHKHLDVFDTTDETYRDYWGPVNFPPYSVEAGHLFNERQIHAIVFHSDDTSTGMYIYLKKDGEWLNIFKDTTIEAGSGACYPRLMDWNGDGIKDVGIFHPSPIAMMSVIDTWDVWLMDRNADKLHPVNNFRELENPIVDSLSGNIVTSLYYHGDKESAYKFENYSLVKLYDLRSEDDDGKPDSVTLTLYNKGKVHKTVKTSTANVKRYIPGWKGWE